VGEDCRNAGDRAKRTRENEKVVLVGSGKNRGGLSWFQTRKEMGRDRRSFKREPEGTTIVFSLRRQNRKGEVWPMLGATTVRKWRKRLKKKEKMDKGRTRQGGAPPKCKRQTSIKRAANTFKEVTTVKRLGVKADGAVQVPGPNIPQTPRDSSHNPR